VDIGTGESVAEGPALIIRVALPAVLAVLLALALLFTSSQLGAAVVREKDQRSMEMIITSINTSQLVAGKILGMTLLSLTQMVIWGGGGLIAVILLLWGDVNPGSISIPWDAVIWALILGVPGYFLYAIIAAGLGIIAGDTQQAQQLAGFLGFIGMFPFYFAGGLLGAPNSPAAVGLSLFPLTAPSFTLLRMALTEVPLWQLVASFGILVLCLGAGMWAVSRIFRAAMLIYGKSLKPKEIWRALSQA
jgi:ABC-2 type transport system permease protein